MKKLYIFVLLSMLALADNVWGTGAELRLEQMVQDLTGDPCVVQPVSSATYVLQVPETARGKLWYQLHKVPTANIEQKKAHLNRLDAAVLANAIVVDEQGGGWPQWSIISAATVIASRESTVEPTWVGFSEENLGALREIYMKLLGFMLASSFVDQNIVTCLNDAYGKNLLTDADKAVYVYVCDNMLAGRLLRDGLQQDERGFWMLSPPVFPVPVAFDEASEHSTTNDTQSKSGVEAEPEPAATLESDHQANQAPRARRKTRPNARVRHLAKQSALHMQQYSDVVPASVKVGQGDRTLNIPRPRSEQNRGHKKNAQQRRDHKRMEEFRQNKSNS